MGRKTASGLIFSRSGYSFTTGDGNSSDGNIRYCSRLRCSASLCSSKKTEVGKTARDKHIRVSSIVGASSQLISSARSLLKSHSNKQSQQKRTRTTTQETTNAANSARRASMNPNYSTRAAESNLRGKKKNESKFMPTSSGNQMVVTDHSKPESRVLLSFSADEHGELGTCSAQLNLTAAKQVTRHSRCNTPESSHTSTRCFSASTNTGLAVNHTAQRVGAGMKYTCRNSKGSEIRLDVTPSRFSANSGFGRRVVNSVQKSHSSGRSSLGSDKSTSASEDFSCQQSSTRSKKQHHDMRLVHNITNVAPSRREATRIRQQGQVDTSSFISEHTSSARLPDNELGSASASASSTGDEVDAASVSRASSVNTDGNQNLSMEGIVNSCDCEQSLLLALERIEQDEQSYEQELGLGNDLLLDALSFIDRHRDMRMDIDNMTYEELLALEEKIGTVSTGLTKEVLSSCLVRSTFKTACLDPEITNHEGEEEGEEEEEEAKCSICQEEYDLGEELGELACSHRYHIACIHQWFMLKNWCPICKVYVSPAS